MNGLQRTAENDLRLAMQVMRLPKGHKLRRSMAQRLTRTLQRMTAAKPTKRTVRRVIE